MNYDDVRDLLVTQWTYTGGPNEDKAAEWYTDETVLEFPQSGERFRGRDNITAWRQRYPARPSAAATSRPGSPPATSRGGPGCGRLRRGPGPGSGRCRCPGPASRRPRGPGRRRRSC
jgi:hypothetical protein